MWSDSIQHYISDLGLKMSIAYTTHTVAEARAVHDLAPVATAALGRALTGALLLAGDFKNQEGVSLKIEGDGPLGTVYADAYQGTKVRGYVEHPQVDVPAKYAGKMDVGRAVGQGMLYVTRYSLLRQHYQSAIQLVSGEIAEDLAYYLTASEQIPSAVSLGVLVNRNVEIEAAGGVLIQALPDVEQEALQQVESNLQKLGTMTTAMKQYTPTEITQILSEGLDFRLLQERPVEWECTCSREAFAEALRKLTPQAKEELLADPEIEMVCHYCNQHYKISQQELQEILKEG